MASSSDNSLVVDAFKLVKLGFILVLPFINQLAKHMNVWTAFISSDLTSRGFIPALRQDLTDRG
jgi:hypothetical protein